MSKSVFIYAALLAVFGLGVYAALERGRQLYSPQLVSAVERSTGLPAHTDAAAADSASLLANLRQNLQDPLPRLFIQLLLIVLVARVCGWGARYLGQPAVVGETIAGILLGPSLLGWVWPSGFEFVFPQSSLATLRLLSQVGVCLFMFLVGMELDAHQLKRQARTAILVSQVSILFPFLLGLALALFLFPGFAAPGAPFVVFALFLGISMSITAFPVLARILEERALTRTALGSIALACAAAGDITAWSALAFVAAVAKAASLLASALSLGLALVFAAVLFFWLQPRLPRWLDRAAPGGHPPATGVVAAVLVFVFACALATDVMGLHALFGAFLAGVVMPPRGEFREFLRVRLEHFGAVFLLPLFFAYIGLRTHLGLLTEPGGWLLCLGLILVATTGKLGGAMFSARFSGVSWHDAFALGALMNTRGLVELVALNLGYDLGILSPRIFAMLVLMALVTTGMTGPLLNLGAYLRRRTAPALA